MSAMQRFTEQLPQPGEYIEALVSGKQYTGRFDVSGGFLMLGIVTSDGDYIPLTNICKWWRRP